MTIDDYWQLLYWQLKKVFLQVKAHFLMYDKRRFLEEKQAYMAYKSRLNIKLKFIE